MMGIHMKKTIFVSLLILLSGCTSNTVNQTSKESGLCGLVEAAINFDELQKFYHVDHFPDRVPLKINLGSQATSCPGLEKFGAPVIIVNEESAAKMINDVVMKIDVKEVAPNAVDLTLWYPPEGALAHMRFENIKSKWIMTDSLMFER
jgi:hypothetical protein